MRTYQLQVRLLQVSLILSLLVVLAGFFGAWGNRADSSAPNSQLAGEKAPPPVQPPVKIVAIGDSYTYGYPEDPGKSWTKGLEKLPNTTVVNKGKTYQTSQDLAARFDADVLNEKPTHVIIFVGNGDALRGLPLLNFQVYIREMVQKAEVNRITPILALPMPYPGVQQAIKELREWELKFAQEKNLKVLDFSMAVMDAGQKYLETYSKDGKYPSEKGYQAMGEYALQQLTP